jgi:hypothetical protein
MCAKNYSSVILRALHLGEVLLTASDTWVVFTLCRTEIVVDLGITEVIENYSVWVWV